jgi:hypothetical protein
VLTFKTVQARMRHANARTTLDTYGHLWPDADESTRSAIGAVIVKRMDSIVATADGNGQPLASPQVSALTDSHVEVQRELRPARLRVFADIVVLACNRFTCGNMLIGCWRVCAWSDVPAGGLRAKGQTGRVKLRRGTCLD